MLFCFCYTKVNYLAIVCSFSPSFCRSWNITTRRPAMIFTSYVGKVGGGLRGGRGRSMIYMAQQSHLKWQSTMNSFVYFFDGTDGTSFVASVLNKGLSNLHWFQMLNSNSRASFSTQSLIYKYKVPTIRKVNSQVFVFERHLVNYVGISSGLETSARGNHLKKELIISYS